MKDKKQSIFKFSTSTHLFFYIALYFGGAAVGFQGGWVVAVILSELKIIQPPWHIVIIFIFFILCVYIPKNLFAKTIPAICPSCGGATFLKWDSKPLQYICTECANVHKTSLSLSGR